MKYSQKYPEAVKVRLLQETVVTIGLKKGVLSVNQESFEKDLYLDESVNYNSKESLNYSFFFELDQIEASSLLYKDGKYTEVKVEEFKEKDELNDSFYDDSKSLSFIYPNLNKGAISKLKYNHNIKNPRFLSPFYFGEFFPVVKNKVTFIVDKGVELAFKNINVGTHKLNFSKEEKRSKTIYQWELKDQKEYDFEPYSPTFKSFVPHIVPMIKSYKKGNEKVTLLGEVSDLYEWYYSLVKNVNQEETDAELISLVDEITRGKENDVEKVKAIYYWVQKNIKYIAFEYALGGFIPRESNDVYRKKYGDCKDNSSILAKMLDIAGLKGSLTWIGTRSIPYTYEEVPTPAVDNHMILTYESEGKTYFLDATGRYIKFGLPTSFIQGKEALVADGDNFKIRKVPVVAAEDNAIVDVTKIRLEDQTLVGSSATEVTGYPKISLFNRLESKNTETLLKQFYNARFSKGNNKFLILDLKEEDKYSYDESFKLNYDFKIEDYAKALGDEIYINLNLNKQLSDYKLDKKRKNSIEYKHKSFYSYTTELEIPENYKVDYLPENIAISNDFITCNINYTEEDNKIIYKHTVKLDYLILTTEEQKQVNDLIKKVENGYKEIIILKKQ